MSSSSSEAVKVANKNLNRHERSKLCPAKIHTTRSLQTSCPSNNHSRKQLRKIIGFVGNKTLIF
jgi:hypothetical protein